MALVYVWLAFLHGCIFILGCAVGSFLNVCIYRMATGRSVSWPGSHCGACVRPIAGYHNIPLVTYLWLRGRCARCGAAYSMRYFFVELLTGLIFVGLFVAEIGLDWHSVWRWGGYEALQWGVLPDGAIPYFLAHALLGCLFVVAVGSLADGHEIPPVVVICGAVVGVSFASLCPQYVVAPGWTIPGLLAVVALLRIARLDRSAADVAWMAGGFLGWPVLVAALGATLLIPRGRPGLRLALILPVVWFAWPWLARLTLND